MPQREKEELNSGRTVVVINGCEYAVKGEAPEYIRELAAYVDKKMRQVGQRFPHLTEQKLAVLTALNIADELHKVQQDYDTLVKLIQEEKRA